MFVFLKAGKEKYLHNLFHSVEIKTVISMPVALFTLREIKEATKFIFCCLLVFVVDYGVPSHQWNINGFLSYPYVASKQGRNFFGYRHSSHISETFIFGYNQSGLSYNLYVCIAVDPNSLNSSDGS